MAARLGALILCLAVLAFGVAWVTGLSAGGLDVAEACELRGQPWDCSFHAEHPEDQAISFPVRRRCNAGHDLVPAWVNPVILASAAVIVVVPLWWGRALWRRHRGRR